MRVTLHHPHLNLIQWRILSVDMRCKSMVECECGCITEQWATLSRLSEETAQVISDDWGAKHKSVGGGLF